LRRFHLTPTTGVALAALVLAASGGAYGAGAGSSAAITACVHHGGGGLYLARKCARRDKRLTWNEIGPTGPRGLPGPQGLQGLQGLQGVQGPPASDMWVRADETGHVIASSGVTASNVRGGTGFYAVPVGRDVSHCASVASEDKTSNGAIVTNVQVVSRIIPSVSTTIVYVNAQDTTGTAKDTGFDLAVYC
jgi:hypothetical protein